MNCFCYNNNHFDPSSPLPYLKQCESLDFQNDLNTIIIFILSLLWKLMQECLILSPFGYQENLSEKYWFPATWLLGPRGGGGEPQNLDIQLTFIIFFENKCEFHKIKNKQSTWNETLRTRYMKKI